MIDFFARKTLLEIKEERKNFFILDKIVKKRRSYNSVNKSAEGHRRTHDPDELCTEIVMINKCLVFSFSSQFTRAQ